MKPATYFFYPHYHQLPKRRLATPSRVALRLTVLVLALSPWIYGAIVLWS